jgi:hypothetical protein
MIWDWIRSQIPAAIPDSGNGKKSTHEKIKKIKKINFFGKAATYCMVHVHEVLWWVQWSAHWYEPFLRPVGVGIALSVSVHWLWPDVDPDEHVLTR